MLKNVNLISVMSFIHRRVIGKLPNRKLNKANKVFKEYLEIITPDTIKVHNEIH